MSLAINIKDVEAVLIGGTWYDVADHSLHFDTYEFRNEGETIARGGQSGLVSSTGYLFRHADGAIMAGPSNAIESVRLAG